HGHGTARPMLFSLTRDQRKQQHNADDENGRDEKHRSFEAGRQIGQDCVDPEESEVGPGRGLDDGWIGLTGPPATGRAWRRSRTTIQTCMPTSASRMPGMTKTCRVKKRESVGPAMMGPPSMRSTSAPPTKGTRLRMDAPM